MCANLSIKSQAGGMIFGYVNHESLLPKLHFYGIQGVSEIWFRSYLTERK